MESALQALLLRAAPEDPEGDVEDKVVSAADLAADDAADDEDARTE